MNTKFLFGISGLALVAAFCFAGTKSDSAHGLIVHEWGTFTSLQGSDGTMMMWNPSITAELPKFVYAWQNPGLDRHSTSPYVLNKGGISSLQRMETPVVYFYSDRERTVDLTVKFPQGFITEWFPQAGNIGPSKNLMSRIDENMIQWPDIHVLPARLNPRMTNALVEEKSGSHYFAARETDADFVQNGTEVEKFLFYRGVGNFKTPLQVSMKTARTVTLENQSDQPLKDLFVLGIKNGAGQFLHVDQLTAHEIKTVELSTATEAINILSAHLGAAMATALTAQGLYAREASAMVHTWENSWFTEQGTRVLYLLPNTWTDATLPMQVSPKPAQLTRVMVGRAEIVSPAVEQQLVADIKKIHDGYDAAITQDIHEVMKSLGRFAMPVVQKAIKKVPSDQAQLQRVYQTIHYLSLGTGGEK